MDQGRLSSAESLESSGNYDEAISEYLILASEIPDDAQVRIHLASCYGLRGNFPEAEKWAREALVLDSNSGPAHYYLGCALRDQSKLGEAFVHLEKGWALLEKEFLEGPWKNTLGGGVGVKPMPIHFPPFQAKVKEDTERFRWLMRFKKEYHCNTKVPFTVTIPPGFKRVGFLRKMILKAADYEVEIVPKRGKFPMLGVNVVGKVSDGSTEAALETARFFLQRFSTRTLGEQTLPIRYGQAVVIYYCGSLDGLEHGKASIRWGSFEILLEIKAPEIEPFRRFFEDWVQTLEV